MHHIVFSRPPIDATALGVIPKGCICSSQLNLHAALQGDRAWRPSDGIVRTGGDA